MVRVLFRPGLGEASKAGLVLGISDVNRQVPSFLIAVNFTNLFFHQIMLRGRREEIQIMILDKYFTHLCQKRAYLYGIPICAFVLD